MVQKKKKIIKKKLAKKKQSSKKSKKYTDKNILEEIIRVDHAGEYGATKIHRHTFKPICNIGYDSFIEYESLSIIRYAIHLIKKGFYIDDFHIKEDIGFIHYKTEKIDVCLVSLDKNNRDISLLNPFNAIDKTSNEVVNPYLGSTYAETGCGFRGY